MVSLWELEMSLAPFTVEKRSAKKATGNHIKSNSQVMVSDKVGNEYELNTGSSDSNCHEYLPRSHSQADV